MKRKQGTFSREISEVLAYYRAIAQRNETSQIEDRATRKFGTGPRLQVASNKAAVSRTR